MKFYADVDGALSIFQGRRGLEANEKSLGEETFYGGHINRKRGGGSVPCQLLLRVRLSYNSLQLTHAATPARDRVSDCHVMLFMGRGIEEENLSRREKK